MAFAERAVIELYQQFLNRPVEIFQGEESMVPESGDDPVFHHEYAAFYLGLAVSHQMQVVWGPPEADSGSPILFIRFVGLSTNWLPAG